MTRWIVWLLVFRCVVDDIVFLGVLVFGYASLMYYPGKCILYIVVFQQFPATMPTHAFNSLEERKDCCSL